MSDSLSIPKLIEQANQSAREATLVCQANAERLEKLPVVTLERIQSMVHQSQHSWWLVEQSIASVIARKG